MQNINGFRLICKERGFTLLDNLTKFTDILKAFVPVNNGYTCYIAGGAIRRAIMGEKSVGSDIDLFFLDERTFDVFYNVLSLNKDLFELVSNTENNACFKWNGIPVQLVKKFVKDSNGIEDILNEFDFTICQFAVSYCDLDTLYAGDMALFDLARRRLVVNKITYPVASLRRMIKYTKQGFYACSGTLKTFLKVSKDIDLEDTPTYID